MTRRSRPLLIVGVLALASACGGGTTESTAPAAAPAGTAATADSQGAAPSSQAPPAAASAGTDATVAEAAAPSTEGTAASEMAEVPEVLMFSTVDLTGAPVDGASYAGKPVAFWFWAPG